MPPFVVLALPRSRTKWLAEFLTYDPWICGHDELQHMQSLDDVATWFTQPNIGSVETAAAPFWRLLLRMQPGAQIVTVRRPAGDVLNSLARHGIGGDTVDAIVRACDRKLDQIERRVPGVLSVKFDDLARESTCRAIFERCLGMRYDITWWRTMRQRHISGNLRAQLRHSHAYLPRFLKLARTAKQRMLADMAPPAPPPEGFTFQTEDFETTFRDAEPLIREHVIATRDSIDDFKTKNWAMMRTIDQIGSMQIMTARSNGRVFGYLMTIVGPSLDDVSRTEALHAAFFVSKDCPGGLGLKLQRAALDALHAKGVNDVFARTGMQGSGPRLDVLYRRLGFEEFGTMYRCDLTAKAS